MEQRAAIPGTRRDVCVRKSIFGKLDSWRVLPSQHSDVIRKRRYEIDRRVSEKPESKWKSVSDAVQGNKLVDQ